MGSAMRELREGSSSAEGKVVARAVSPAAGKKNLSYKKRKKRGGLRASAAAPRASAAAPVAAASAEPSATADSEFSQQSREV